MSLISPVSIAVASLIRTARAEGATAPAAATEELIGNPKFNLTQAKLYGWGGAEIAVNGSRLRVTYTNCTAYNGVVHDYQDNPAWNGNPINIAPYSKLIITVEGDGGAPSRLQINDTIVVASLTPGTHTIDLAAKKADVFAPWTAINKIEFVNPAGTGQYIVSMRLAP
jgi:hypothetical protein